MSKAICIMGQSGSGKTYSLRNLDPKKTFYIDADGKGLNWKGWKKSYNSESKNYFKTDDPETIKSLIRQIDGQKHIKYLIVDTINGIMIADEMRRMKEKGYDKWQDLSNAVYYIVHDSNTYRDDLVVILIAHVQVEEDGFTHILTNGKKLNKIQLETMLNNVLLAKVDGDKYAFETKANNSTAKTYAGAFEESVIENDIVKVIEALDEF